MHFTKLKMLNGIPAIQIIILQENWIALKKIGTSGILGWKVKCLVYELLHAFTMQDEWANLCAREGWSFP